MSNKLLKGNTSTTTQEWPAEDYAIGSYIQASIADIYLKYLTIKPHDHVLDIGCGNAAFSCKIIDQIPQGSFIGIDASENMLELARKKIAKYPYAAVQKENVLTMKFINQFDYIVTFWCLHWCADHIKEAFQNIYHALKPNGKVLALFPSGDDSFITSYQTIKASEEFSYLNHFKSPITYQDLPLLQDKIYDIPFKQIKIELIKHKLLLPSLDIFCRFVNGLAFFHGQIPLSKISIVNNAIVNTYEKYCQEEYQGEHWFSASIYLVQAEK